MILKNSIYVHFIILLILDYRQNRTEIDSKNCRSGHCIVFRSLFIFVVDIFAFDPRPSYPPRGTLQFFPPSLSLTWQQSRIGRRGKDKKAIKVEIFKPWAANRLGVRLYALSGVCSGLGPISTCFLSVLTRGTHGTIDFSNVAFERGIFFKSSPRYIGLCSSCSLDRHRPHKSRKEEEDTV